MLNYPFGDTVKLRFKNKLIGAITSHRDGKYSSNIFDKKKPAIYNCITGLAISDRR
jgi:hypothetical protein